jgi:hypothetical protein
MPADVGDSYHEPMDHFEAHLKREGMPVLRSAGRTYPSVGAVLASLDWLEKEALVVVGVDGVRVDGDFVARSLDHIADFSTLEGQPVTRSHASVEAVRQTLNAWGDEVQFVDMRLTGHDTTRRDVVVTVVAATVLALGFVYLVLRAAFSNWGI